MVLVRGNTHAHSFYLIGRPATKTKLRKHPVKEAGFRLARDQTQE